MTDELTLPMATRAHRMLTDHDHIDHTRRLGGSPDLAELDGPGLRWPGYLGSEARPGSAVLAFANIHRGFRSYRMAADPGGTIARFTAASRILQALPDPGTEDLLAYASAQRAMYERGLSGGWRVGHNFAVAAAAAGVTLDAAGVRQLAYVNASCCQFPETTKLPQAAKIKTALKDACLSRHPLGEVVDLVQPRVILVSSVAVWQHLYDTGLTEHYPLVCFHQQMGDVHITREVTLADQRIASKTPHAVWVPALRRHLADDASRPQRAGPAQR